MAALKGGSSSVVDAATQTVNIDAVLATIRAMESGGNYTVVTSGGSDACGAYQYISSTWSAMFDRALAAGYLAPGTQKTARACQAPPAVQDAVARYDVTTFLNSVGGNVALVPLHWYYPAAINNPSLLSFTPPGNSISIGQYQSNWMARYRSISGDPTKYVTNSGLSGGGTQSTAQTANLTGIDLSGLLGKIPILGQLWQAGKDTQALAGLFINAFENWRYIAEVLAGMALITIGGIIIVADVGRQKAPQVVGEVVKAAA